MLDFNSDKMQSLPAGIVNLRIPTGENNPIYLLRIILLRITTDRK
jgi:hypothetical protein